MRALKLLVNVIVLFVVLPVAIVGVLGFLFSPLQTTARATEPRVVMEANDIMLSQVVQEQVELALECPDDNSAAETQIDSEPPIDSASSEVFGGEADLDWAYSEDISNDPIAAGYLTIKEPSGDRYSSEELLTYGAIYDGAYCYTWYSENILPGEGLAIEGRHVSDEGYVVDAQNRVVVASNDLPYGTEVDIPFGDGKGIVLDTGCASGVLDIYTSF